MVQTTESIGFSAKTPFRTLTDLGAKQLLSYAVSVAHLFLVPLMVTHSQPADQATAQLAALSVSSLFEDLYFMVAFFFNAGCSAVIGSCMGSGDITGAETLLIQALVSGAMVGIIMGVTLTPLLPLVLRALVDPEQGQQVIEYAFLYVAPQIAGSVVIIVQYTLLSVFMGSCRMGIYLFLLVGQ